MVDLLAFVVDMAVVLAITFGCLWLVASLHEAFGGRASTNRSYPDRRRGL